RRRVRLQVAGVTELEQRDAIPVGAGELEVHVVGGAVDIALVDRREGRVAATIARVVGAGVRRGPVAEGVAVLEEVGRRLRLQVAEGHRGVPGLAAAAHGGAGAAAGERVLLFLRLGEGGPVQPGIGDIPGVERGHVGAAAVGLDAGRGGRLHVGPQVAGVDLDQLVGRACQAAGAAGGAVGVDAANVVGRIVGAQRLNDVATAAGDEGLLQVHPHLDGAEVGGAAGGERVVVEA